MGRSPSCSGSERAETVRKWVRQAEVDAGSRPATCVGGLARGSPAQAGGRRAETGERDPQGRFGFLRGRTRPATALIVRFINEHKDSRVDGGLRWGVESICAVLTEHGVKIAPSTYYDAVGAAAQPQRASATRT